MKPGHQIDSEDKLGPPPAAALARLRWRIAQASPLTSQRRQPTPSTITGTAPKHRRGRKRATVVPAGGRVAKTEEQDERAAIEAWVPSAAADRIQCLAQVHGLPPGTLVQLLARDAVKVRPGGLFSTPANPRNSPWHIRWTISKREFAELDALAVKAGQSVGSYCVARALSVLAGKSGASTAPLLLTRPERGILAGLHKAITSYTMIVTLKCGTDLVISGLRRAAQMMTTNGPSATDDALVKELGLLVEELALRASFGADSADIKQRIHHVAVGLVTTH